MKGYKAFNSNLTCRGFQYEIGKEYTFGGEPIPCRQGFHFCKTIRDCYKFYEPNERTRICEVEALGEVKTDDGTKYVTNKIKIIAEVTEGWARKGNSNPLSTGYCNTGAGNTGNWNNNNHNSGDNNYGYRNTGHFNKGSWNSGSHNNGTGNSGDVNIGDINSGNHNSGHYNSGTQNSGNHNTGFLNSGSYNTGDFNSGYCNSGDWNSGNWSSGCFCTEKEPTLKFFDKDSDWTHNEWMRSQARILLDNCPQNRLEFIYSADMTDEEKANHPCYEVTGGFIKEVVVTAEDKQKWWDGLKKKEKKAIMSLPNFDADKFKLCTGM